MPVESAADRAALFASTDFAEAGTYTPSGGSAVAVTAIVDRGQKKVGADLGGGVILDGPQAWINKDQLAAWSRDAVLAIGAESWTVKDGRSDESGAVWVLDLRVA